MPDGSALGLHVSRFDERQRRLRLRLSKTATCWDYAPLIDVVRREPGFDAHRFTGKTASESVVGNFLCSKKPGVELKDAVNK